MLPQSWDSLLTLFNFFTNLRQDSDKNKDGDDSSASSKKGERSALPAALSKDDEIFMAELLPRLSESDRDKITNFLDKFPPRGNDPVSSKLRSHAQEHFRYIVVNLPIDKAEHVITATRGDGRNNTTKFTRTKKKTLILKDHRVGFLEFVASELRRMSFAKVYKSLRVHNIVPADMSKIISGVKGITGDKAVVRSRKIALVSGIAFGASLLTFMIMIIVARYFTLY